MLLDIHILDDLLIPESLQWYYWVEKGKKKLRILVHTAKLHFLRVILTYNVTAVYENASSLALLWMLGVPAS